MYKIWLSNIKLKNINLTNELLLNATKEVDNMLLLNNGVIKVNDTYKLYKLDVENLVTDTLDNYCELENNKKIDIVYQTETWNQIKHSDSDYFNNKIISVERHIIYKNQLVSMIFEYYNNKLHDFYFLSKEAPNHEYVKKDISLFLSYIL